METGKNIAKAEIEETILHQFSELFGDKLINDKKINVEETIALLSSELDKSIEEVLNSRREMLNSKVQVKQKYGFPNWDKKFEDPINGELRSFEQIVQGLIDNFMNRKTDLAWHLNEGAPIPADAHPLKNNGLELTGPWNPLDMAIKQVNADVAATMGPDDEDAAPPDFIPSGSAGNPNVGLFLSRNNERLISARKVRDATVSKRGNTKTYKIEKPEQTWPTSFHRVPGIHLQTPWVKVDGRPATSLVVDYVIHSLNDYGSLSKAGRGLYFYQPKTLNPSEAFIVAKLVWKLEKLLGAEKPGVIIKFKALYEEGNLGLFLPVVMWTWRHWLIGTNVGRWDYLGSLMEMWKDERTLPDPQNGTLMGMTSPHMMAYQRYNALMNLMAGMSAGDFTHGAPIGGMAAVMLYPETDPYGRARHNPVTLRAMKMDKLRERLIGLIFVPEDPLTDSEPITLEEAIEGKVKGALYDTYRQSWVASPDKDYVAAGNAPLRTSLEKLQAMVDSPEEWTKIDGNKIAPSIPSGLTKDERELLINIKLLNKDGKITPWIVQLDQIDVPEKLLSSTSVWFGTDLWNSLYNIPEGEVTIENIQHAFYMAANYGFQVLNGNLAAAIDDYKLIPNRVVRFMNDLATYRIFAAWLWTISKRRVRVTKDGWLKKPSLTQDGVIPAKNAVEVKAGTEFTAELLEQLWEIHNEWTQAFFEDFDRLTALRILSFAMANKLKASASANILSERSMEMLVREMVRLSDKQTSQADTIARIGSIMGCEPSSVEQEIEHLTTFTDRIREIISETYGKHPSYKRVLSYEEAAEKIASLLTMDYSIVLDQIRGSAPRFDRTKALVIMDVLKRQFLSPLYVQHSPRVLFTIAERSDEENAKILDAVYYVDERGKSILRDSAGNPSRDILEKAVQEGKIPAYALKVHDYVYDIHP